MKKKEKSKIELKDSYFDGFEYKDYKVRTKLVIEGQSEYKPLQLSSSKVRLRRIQRPSRERQGKVLRGAIHLDAKNKVIGVDMVSQGTLDSFPVYPREVYKPAILNSAASVIFVHAHPSGDSGPSNSDREITGMLKEAGKLMGIEVIDHVIIGNGSYYSFADRGELQIRADEKDKGDKSG